MSHASLRPTRGVAVAGERGAESGTAPRARPRTAEAQLGPGGSEKQWVDQMVMNHKQDRFPWAG